MSYKGKGNGEPRGFLNPFEHVAGTAESLDQNETEYMNKTPFLLQSNDTLPPEMNILPMLIKNCLKKDSTTKIKALQGLISCLSHPLDVGKPLSSNASSTDEVILDIGWNYMIQYFTKIFDVCSQDESYMVRERSIHLLFLLIKWNKKILAKLLQDIIVPWLTCCVDVDPSVKRPALDVFHQVFDSSEKVIKVMHMTRENICQYITEGIQYSLFSNFNSSYQQERQISSSHNILSFCISKIPDMMLDIINSHKYDLTIHKPDICLSKCFLEHSFEPLKKSIYTVFKQLIPYSKDSMSFCKTYLVSSDSGIKELVRTREAFELTSALIRHLCLQYNDNETASELLENWINNCYHHSISNPQYMLHMILNITSILESNTITIQSQRAFSLNKKDTLSFLLTENAKINICYCIEYLIENGTSLPIQGTLLRSQEELAISIAKLLLIVHKDSALILKKLVAFLSLDSNVPLVTGVFMRTLVDELLLFKDNYSLSLEILISILDVLERNIDLQNKPFYNVFVTMMHIILKCLHNTDSKIIHGIKRLFNLWISSPNVSSNTLNWVDMTISKEYHIYDSTEELCNDMETFITCFLRTIDRSKTEDQWSKFVSILNKSSELTSNTYSPFKVLKHPNFQHQDLFQFISHIPFNVLSESSSNNRDMIHLITESFSNLLRSKMNQNLYIEFHNIHVVLVKSILSKDDIIIIIERWYQDLLKNLSSPVFMMNSLLRPICEHENISMLECLLEVIFPVELESQCSTDGSKNAILKLIAELYMNTHLEECKWGLDARSSFLDSKKGFREALFWIVFQRNIDIIANSQCDLAKIQEYSVMSSKLLIDTYESGNVNINKTSFLCTFDSIVQRSIIDSIPVIFEIIKYCYLDDYHEITWSFLMLQAINSDNSMSKKPDCQPTLRSCSFICFIGVLLMKNHELNNYSTLLLIFLQIKLLHFIDVAEAQEQRFCLLKLVADLTGYILFHSESINNSDCVHLEWKWNHKLDHPEIFHNNFNPLSMTLFDILNKLLLSQDNIWVVHLLLTFVKDICNVVHDINDLIQVNSEKETLLWWKIFLSAVSQSRIQSVNQSNLNYDKINHNIASIAILLSMDYSEANSNQVRGLIDKLLVSSKESYENIHELLNIASMILVFITPMSYMNDIKTCLLELMKQYKDHLTRIHRHILIILYNRYGDQLSSHIEEMVLSHEIACEYYNSSWFWTNALPLFEKHCSALSKNNCEVSKIFKDTFYGSEPITSVHSTSIIIAIVQHHIHMKISHSLLSMDNYTILNHGLFDHIDHLFFKVDREQRYWDKNLKSYFDCWDLQINDENIPIRRVITSLEWLSLFRKCLLYFPSIMRCWWGDCLNSFHKGPFGTFIRTVIQEHLYKDVVRYQIEGLLDYIHKKPKPSTMNISTCQSSHHESFIRASIPIEDQQQVEIIIRFPMMYPLLPVIVQGGQRIGVSESVWRKWLFSSQTLLSSQHGSSLIDGLMLWEQNTRKRFEGSSECAICYCILQVTDLSLPTHPCKTCKNKFHSVCLYKWFKSSGNSTCPLCRSIFS